MKRWYEGIRIVEADSVADYLAKYYKKARMTDTLLDSYTEEYRKNGFIATSHHDNVLGEFIGWPSTEAIARYYES